MSNLPAIFSQAVPAHLSGMTPANVAALNAAAANGAGGGESINRISLKQSRFRLVLGGEERKVLAEPSLDVVVIQANPNVSKTWYAKQWNPADEPEAPDCFSNNGVAPHPDSRLPQCNSCAQCPQNEWGSYINPTTQKKSKACSDSKRLAIVPPNQLGGDMFQLAIPPASLKDWAAYVKLLSQVSPPVPYMAVVTRVSFDTDASYPKLKFEPVRFLSQEEFNKVMSRYDSDEAKLVASLDNGLAPATVAPAPALNIPGQQPVVQTAAAQAAPVQQAPVQQAADSAGWGDAPADVTQQAAPATQSKPRAPRGSKSTQAPAPAPAPAPAATSGWGDEPAPAAAQAAAPAQQAAPVGNTFDNSGTGAAVAEVASGSNLDDVFGAGWD